MTFDLAKAKKGFRNKFLKGEISEEIYNAKMLESKDVEKAIKEEAAREAASDIRIKNVTEKIDTKIPTKKAFQQENAKRAAKRLAKKAGKKLPGLLGILTGAAGFIADPSNASAAEMIGVESLGSNPAIEDPTSPAYKARMRMLRKRKKR